MAGEGLRADPELRFGTLANGMRYVIRRNRTPPGDASLRLRIDTGSLNEADDQRGVAHFLEHMVLNGTKNVPEGEFVKRLERAGLRFGPDTNASTDFGQTVFKLDLPETDDKTLDEAFFLLREVAGRASLDAAAIDRERGIILSEERSRATPGFRQLTDELAWLYPGQILPNRLPIGTAEVIRTVPPQRMRDFYHGWYRPERATLVVAGDIDVAATERRIRAQFDDWRGVGPARTHVVQGRPAVRSTQARVFVDPAVAAGVEINWVRPADLEPDGVPKRRRELEEALASAILNRRLEQLAQADVRPPFVTARVGVSELEQTAGTTTIGAQARLGDWRAALRSIDAEQRRLLQFGVTADELERELTGVRASLEAGVASAATRTSASHAEAIVSAINRGSVVTTPADRLAMFEAAVKGLDSARINAAAKRLFEGSGPLLYLTLPRPVVDAEQALLASFEVARKMAVSPPVVRSAIAWPYNAFGSPGVVTSRREIAPVATTVVRFANGVRLTVRPSQTRKEQVFVQLRFGNGRLAIAPNRESPEWALGPALSFGGTKLLDADSLNRALTGKLVGAALDVGDDRFALLGATRPADFATQMQFLAATLTDAAWRPLGWERVKSTANQIHERFESSPGGVLVRDSGRLLRSGDNRWALPSRMAMRMSTIKQARQLLDPELANGPLEVIIVGDITVDRAIAETAATLGALPPRTAPRLAAGTIRFPGPTPTPVTLFHKGREDQAVGFMAWPTTGFGPQTRQLARNLSLVGAVFQLRLTDRLREAEGVSYSPSASHAASQTWSDYGYLAAQIEAPPATLDRFFAQAQAIASDLADRPITADELDRARKPLLQSIERARDGNGFWLSSLGKLDEDPFTLETILTQESDYLAATPASLQAAARRFLKAGAAFRIRVVKGTPANFPPMIVVPVPIAPATPAGQLPAQPPVNRPLIPPLTSSPQAPAEPTTR